MKHPEDGGEIFLRNVVDFERNTCIYILENIIFVITAVRTSILAYNTMI
jgi:hypothetical protein